MAALFPRLDGGFAQHLRQARGEAPFVERLFQPRIVFFHALGQVGIAARHHHRQAGAQPARRARKLDPVHAGHGKVGDHRIDRRLALEDAEGVLARIGFDGAVAEIGQDIDHVHGDERVVVDHEDGCRASRGEGIGQRCASSRAC